MRSTSPCLLTRLVALSTLCLSCIFTQLSLLPTNAPWLLLARTSHPLVVFSLHGCILDRCRASALGGVYRLADLSNGTFNLKGHEWMYSIVWVCVALLECRDEGFFGFALWWLVEYISRDEGVCNGSIRDELDHSKESIRFSQLKEGEGLLTIHRFLGWVCSFPRLAGCSAPFQSFARVFSSPVVDG